MQKTWVQDQEDSPGGGDGNPFPVFLLREIPWTEETGGPTKSQTRLND